MSDMSFSSVPEIRKLNHNAFKDIIMVTPEEPIHKVLCTQAIIGGLHLRLAAEKDYLLKKIM